VATSLSARKISQRTGASRATASKWLDGQPLSRSKQCQLDDWARENQVLVAADLLKILPESRQGEGAGLLAQFCLHFGIAMLAGSGNHVYLDGNPSDEIQRSFLNEVNRTQ